MTYVNNRVIWGAVRASQRPQKRPWRGSTRQGLFDDFPAPASDATPSIGNLPSAETPTPNPSSDAAAPLNDLAAQLRSQFDELQKENAELRRQVDELRRNHNNLDIAQPVPVR